MFLKIMASDKEVKNITTPIIIAETGKQLKCFESLTQDIYIGKIKNGKNVSVDFKLLKPDGAINKSFKNSIKK